jgi:hypothetical protein
MRLAISTAALLLAASAAAAAPTAPPAAPPSPPPRPPRIFAQAGYTQPQVPASACKTVSAAEATCELPGMTAGFYFARAVATSTATAADAEQQITIVAGQQHCTSTFAPDPKAPWAVGAKRTFYAGCIFAIVTDDPMTLRAVYLDAKATKDPAGPTLQLYPQPWTGGLMALPVAIKQ